MTNPQNNTRKDTILIVDDVPANVSILFDFLNENGFKVLVAQDGKRAVQKALYAMPDLILMDIMMPGMNGFDACKVLKENEKTKDIPIIFMTALADTLDKIKGFSLGAADYITKPFQQEEVLARINNHLNFRKMQQRLEQKTEELQLKNRELEAFSRTVAHDLKNPLNVVVGYADILMADQADNSELMEQLEVIAQAGQKMVSIIDALLLLARSSKYQTIEVQTLDMKQIIEQVIQHRLLYLLEKTQGKIIIPENLPAAKGYAPWVEEIWANYLSNGLKYGGQPPRLQLGAVEEGKQVKFWVSDNGPGLSEEGKIQLFTPFTRLHEERAEGHGLGLSIVQQVAEKLGGHVGVDSKEGEGCTFYITLPVGE